MALCGYQLRYYPNNLEINIIYKLSSFYICRAPHKINQYGWSIWFLDDILIKFSTSRKIPILTVEFQ